MIWPHVMCTRSISAQVVNGEREAPTGCLSLSLDAYKMRLREITDHHRLQLQPGKVFNLGKYFILRLSVDVGRGRLDVRGANCDLVAVEVRVNAATLLWVDDKDLGALIGEKETR